MAGVYAVMAALTVLMGLASVGAVQATPGNGNAYGVGNGNGPKLTDQCPGPLDCEVDLGTANSLEARMDDHFLYGHVVDSNYATTERVSGQVTSVGNWGDSGLWTGVYLAGESFRYATAKHYLARGRLTKEDRDAWTAQRDQAKARVDRMVAQYHLLTNIAEGWETTFSPSVNPADTRSPASFGGGVIDGRKGMLMRSCTPSPEDGAEPGKRIEPGSNRRIFGPFPWTDGKSYYCETAPSRDTYAGTTFGLVTAFDLVGTDDPAMRDQIGADLLTLASFLVDHAWTYPRPHGNVSAPPTGHDFDNFVSPLFVYVPLARLNMAQVAKHVAKGTIAQARWDAVFEDEMRTQGQTLAASMEIDAVQANDGYYKYNLHHLTGFNLTRLETDPARLAQFEQALGIMDATTGDDINAHFEAITYAITGEPRRLDAAVAHLRQWRDYRARIQAQPVTDNRPRCAPTGPLECVPQDQIDVVISTPAGSQRIGVPGVSATRRARLPLPVADRPPTDFLWQRPPTQLRGEQGPTHEAAGVDYLAPYWMLRYYSEVAEPFGSPFPPYAGPAH